MNERIKELTKQATIRVNNPTVNSDGKVVCDNWEEGVSLSRLAELVARDCMEMCTKLEKTYLDRRLQAMDFELKNIYAEGERACDSIRHKIKTQYGVK